MELSNLHRPLRILTPERDTLSVPSQRGVCGAEGCSEGTTELKPFCTKHVHLHPHVQDVLRKNQERILEIESVANGARASAESSPAQEILHYVTESGTLSVGRIARELNMPKEAVAKYARALKRARKVRLLKTKNRKKVMVSARVS